MRPTFSHSTRPRAATERSVTMAFTHTQAVVSYCPDLTDPFALSLPVAVLLVGETGPHRIFLLAALHVAANRAKEFEPFDSLIHGLTRRLPDHVKEMEELEGSNVPLERVMSSLAALLRNSLHVSEITSVATTDLKLTSNATERDIYKATVNAATEIASEALYAQIDRTHQLMQASMADAARAQVMNSPTEVHWPRVAKGDPRPIQRLQDHLSHEPTLTVVPTRKYDTLPGLDASYAH
jgi:hypothetical protein